MNNIKEERVLLGQMGHTQTIAGVGCLLNGLKSNFFPSLVGINLNPKKNLRNEQSLTFLKENNMTRLPDKSDLK